MLVSAVLGGCAAVAEGPPSSAVPLADLEEPAAFRQPPADEAARLALGLGAYTGVRVAATDEALAKLLRDDSGEGLAVAAVTENSPAVGAGIEVDDLLIEARVAGDANWQVLEFPSQWRALELRCPVDGTLEVLIDRAGVEREVAIAVEPRLRPAEREVVERLREERRVGVVVRTATEVEARSAGLGPGAGAVVVGLARSSPWRAAGVRFGDLLVVAGDRQIDHPAVLLQAIESAAGGVLRLELVRDGRRAWVDAPLTSREQQTSSLWLPPLYSFERDRDRRSHSFLLGLFSYAATDVAWDFRMFWLLRFAGGDGDLLEEVDG